MKLVEEHRQERRGLEEAIGRLDRYLRISRIDPLNEENNLECPDTLIHSRCNPLRRHARLAHI